MGMDDPDIYNDSSLFGLELIGTVEWIIESYEFNMTIVLMDKEGTFYWAQDSGCSCPMPFEEFTSIEQLESGDFFKLAEHLKERAQECDPGEEFAHAEKELVQLLIKIQTGYRDAA